MNEKLTRQHVVSALVNLFVIVMSLFVIVSLLLKLTGHSPTVEQVLVTSIITLLAGYGGMFKKYVDMRVDHLEQKMDLKFDHVSERMERIEKQMEYRFSRIEKKLGIV